MSSYLFVDGSNLYAGQYELFGPKKYLDFSKDIKSVEESLKIKFEKIYFYASYSPRPKLITKTVEKFLINEGLFYGSAKKMKNLFFYKGHRSLTSGKEKAVDVALASDLVRFSCENRFKYGYVMTGDADFQHCIEIASEKGRVIQLISIENRVPHRLSILYRTYIFWHKSIPKLYSFKKVKLFKFGDECIF